MYRSKFTYLISIVLCIFFYFTHAVERFDILSTKNKSLKKDFHSYNTIFSSAYEKDTTIPQSIDDTYKLHVKKAFIKHDKWFSEINIPITMKDLLATAVCALNAEHQQGCWSCGVYTIIDDNLIAEQFESWLNGLPSDCKKKMIKELVAQEKLAINANTPTTKSDVWTAALCMLDTAYQLPCLNSINFIKDQKRKKNRR